MDLELTLKIWIRRMEVELAGSVSIRGEQDVAIFPPEFVGHGTVYIPAPSQRILACDPPSVEFSCRPLFLEGRTQNILGFGLVRDPVPDPWTYWFPPRIVSLQPGPTVPARAANFADFLKASLEVRSTVVRSVRGMDPVRLAIPDR